MKKDRHQGSKEQGTACSVQRSASSVSFFFRILTSVYCLLTSVFCLLSPASASDWKSFRNDAARAGFTSDDAMPPLFFKWKMQTGDKVLSSPAYSNGKIFVGSYDKKVYAFDAFSGAQSWAVTTGERIDSSPAVDGSTVYVSSWDGSLYALDTENGTQKWKFTAAGTHSSSPVVVNNIVYFTTGYPDQKVYALNGADGAKLWEYALPQPSYSSPAVSGNSLVVGANDGKYYCLNTANGSLLWSYATGGNVYLSSPAISGNAVYAASGDTTRKLFALELTNGSKLWEVALDTTGSTKISSPAVSASTGTVFISGGTTNQKLFAVDTSSGAMKWQKDLGAIGEWTFLSSPSIAGNVVFVGSTTGYLYGYSVTDGTLLAQTAISSPVLSSPTPANGIVYFGANDKYVYAYAVNESTSPTASITSPSDFTAFGNQVVLSGTATDAHFQKYVIQYVDGNHPLVVGPPESLDWSTLSTSFYSVSSSTLYTWNTSTVGEGTYTVRVMAYDIVGNSAEARVILSVDHSPPSLTVSTPVNALVTNQSSVAVSGTTEVGIALTVNGQSVSVDGTGAFTTNVALSEGQNVITVTATDSAGNSRTDARAVTYDKTAPSLTVTAPADNLATNQTPVAVSGAAETGSQVTVNANAVALDENGGFSTAVSLSEGENIITVIGTDTAGNITTVTRNVTLDTSAPSLTVSSPQDNLLSQSASVAVSGSAESGAAVTVNGNAVTNADGSFTTTITLPEGVSAILVKAADAAGNSTTVTRTVTVDSLAPALTVTSPADGLVTSAKQLTVSGSSEAGVTLTLNSQPVTLDSQGNFSFTYALSEGENILTFVATDATGNTSTLARKVTLDSQSPLLTVNAPADGLLTNQKQLDVSGSAEISASVTLNGQAVTLDAQGNFSFTHALSEGANALSFSANDAAGNTTAITRNVTLDTQPPEISISSPSEGLATNQKQLAVSASTEKTATVTLNGESVTPDGNGAFTMTFTLSEGENVFTFSAKDLAGNEAVAERKVVLDTQPPTGSIALVTTSKLKTMTSEKAVSVTLSAQDNVGVGGMQISENSSFDGSWLTFASSYAWNLGDAYGERTLYVKYKDTAGNESEVYTAAIERVAGAYEVTFGEGGDPLPMGDPDTIMVDLAALSSGQPIMMVLTFPNGVSFSGSADVKGLSKVVEMRFETVSQTGKLSSGGQTQVSAQIMMPYGSLSVTSEDALKIYFKKSDGSWEQLKGFQDVDKGAKQVKASTPLVLGHAYQFVVAEKQGAAGTPSVTLSAMNYPNPVHGDTTFAYSLSKGIPTQVVIEVYSVTGKKVLTMMDPTPQDGKYTTAEIDALPNGIYIYRMHVTVSGAVYTKMGKLTLLK